MSWSERKLKLIEIIHGLVDQQAMPDDWWKHALEKLEPQPTKEADD